MKPTSFFVTWALGLAAAAPWTPMERDDLALLAARQGPGGNPGPCGTTTSKTELVKNGNPHKNFKHVQITANHLGGTTGGEITRSDGIAVSLGFESAVSPTEWISGGFSVSVEFSTSEAKTCYVAKGSRACVWQKVPHTAYTVENCEIDLCGKRCGNPFVVKSPNKQGQGNTYCVEGMAWRQHGASYWDPTPRPAYVGPYGSRLPTPMERDG